MDIQLDGKRIGCVHYPDIAKKMAESGKYDLVFYGHTHKPWEEKIGNCRLVNPGELAGQRFKPTFAIYDTATNRLELKILERL
jgi:predicted phosphodiesterase